MATTRAVTGFVLTSLLVAAVAEASAQTADQRVRVQFANRSRPALVGHFVTFRADTIVIAEDQSAETVRILAGDVGSLEIWERRSQIGEGATAGGLMGILVGVVVGMSAHEDPCRGSQSLCYDPGAGATAIGYGLAGGAVGALLGAAVGTFLWDSWRAYHSRQPYGSHRRKAARCRCGRPYLRAKGAGEAISE